jgi:hypothetical protein
MTVLKPNPALLNDAPRMDFPLNTKGPSEEMVDGPPKKKARPNKQEEDVNVMSIKRQACTIQHMRMAELMLPESMLILSPLISFHSTVLSFNLSQGRRTDLPAHSAVVMPVDGTFEVNVLCSSGVQTKKVHTHRHAHRARMNTYTSRKSDGQTHRQPDRDTVRSHCVSRVAFPLEDKGHAPR